MHKILKRDGNEKNRSKKMKKDNRKSRDIYVEAPDQDETYYFIAGYTDSGFPYGITWEENEQMNNDESLFRSMPPEELAGDHSLECRSCDFTLPSSVDRHTFIDATDSI
jgi:hypothetical protein